MTSKNIELAVSKAKQRSEAYKLRPKNLDGKFRSDRKVRPFVISTANDEPRLIVKIIRAENILASNVQTGRSDAVCFLQLGNEEFKSKVQHGTIHPTWNQVFEFGVKQNIAQVADLQQLEIYVRDEEDTVYRDLGKIAIQLGEIFSHTKHLPPQWYDIEATEKQKNKCGRMMLSLRLTGCDAYEFTSVQKQERPAWSPTKAAQSPERRKLFFADNDGAISPTKQATFWEPNIAHKQDEHFSIETHVIKARFLFEHKSMACQVVYGKEKDGTKVCKIERGRSEWNQIITIGKYSDLQDALLIRIRSQVGDQRCFEDVSRIKLPVLHCVKRSGAVARWYPTYTDDAQYGEILLGFKVFNPKNIQVPLYTSSMPSMRQQFSLPTSPTNSQDCQMEIQVQRARDLMASSKQNDNPMLFFLVYGTTCFRSKEVQSTENPIWNQKFHLENRERGSTIRIFTRCQMQQDGVICFQDLGSCSISITDRQPIQDGWFPLQTEEARSGFPELMISVLFFERTEAESSICQSVHLKKRRSSIQELKSRKSKLDDSKFLDEIDKNVENLEDKDTQGIALERLRTIIYDMRPQFVRPMLQSLFKNKNVKLLSTRRSILLITYELCQRHPKIVASKNNLDKILAFLLVQLAQKEYAIHATCALVMCAISLLVRPLLSNSDMQQTESFVSIISSFITYMNHATADCTARMAAAMCASAVIMPSTSYWEGKISKANYTEAECDASFRQDRRFSRHCKHLQEALNVLLKLLLIEVNRFEDLKMTEAPLYAILAAAKITQAANLEGNTSLILSWYTHVQDLLLKFDRLSKGVSRLCWKSQKICVEIIDILLHLLGTEEINSLQKLISQLLKRFCSNSNKHVREAAIDLVSRHKAILQSSQNAEVSKLSNRDSRNLDPFLNVDDKEAARIEAEEEFLPEDNTPSAVAQSKIVNRSVKQLKARQIVRTNSLPTSYNTNDAQQHQISFQKEFRHASISKLNQMQEPRCGGAKESINEGSFLDSIRQSLRENKVDLAFRIALKSEDTSVLLRLMALTQPCYAELARATINVLLSSLLAILQDAERILEILPWLSDALHEPILTTLDPRVVQALEESLFDLSAEPTKIGVYAARLYSKLQN